MEKRIQGQFLENFGEEEIKIPCTERFEPSDNMANGALFGEENKIPQGISIRRLSWEI